MEEPIKRPRITFEEWCRAGLATNELIRWGFRLENDGGNAYAVTVEDFQVSPTVKAKSRTIKKILRGQNCVALIWIDGYLHWQAQKWNLIAAMAEAADQKYGHPDMGIRPDYTVDVQVIFHDEAGSRYHATAPLTYLQGRLEFGPTTPPERIEEPAVPPCIDSPPAQSAQQVTPEAAPLISESENKSTTGAETLAEVGGDTTPTNPPEAIEQATAPPKVEPWPAVHDAPRATPSSSHVEKESFTEPNAYAEDGVDTTPTVKRTEPAQPPPASGASTENGSRVLIDAFIFKLAGVGLKIRRKDIWQMAGYTDATEFERFQRGDLRTTKSAETAIRRVLGMTPEIFKESLAKKQAAK